MAQTMEAHEESEEPDPEFIDKLAAFHAQRGFVFPQLMSIACFMNAYLDQHHSRSPAPSQWKADPPEKTV